MKGFKGIWENTHQKLEQTTANIKTFAAKRVENTDLGIKSGMSTKNLPIIEG